MRFIGFPEYRQQGQALAAELGLIYQEVTLHQFPDGETKLRIPPDSDPRVLVMRSLDQPNDKLIELLMLSRTLREQGCTYLALVAPYLCYMRQDIAFQTGEVISQQVIGRWLAQQFDFILSVDPHLHRIQSLQEIMPDIESRSVSAADALGEFIQQRLPNALLLGPDEESRQWVSRVAARAQLKFSVCRKIRHGDRNVDIELGRADFYGQQVVLVDDMISTGHTLATAAEKLVTAGASGIHCLVTHALLDQTTETLLHKAKIENIWSTDSVSHHSNCISLTHLLATTLRKSHIR